MTDNLPTSPLCVTLTDILSPAQIAMLAQRIQKICAGPKFGEVTIIIDNGKAKFIRSTLSENFDI